MKEKFLFEITRHKAILKKCSPKVMLLKISYTSLLLVTIAILFFSCSDDSDNSVTPSPYFILNEVDTLVSNNSLYIETACSIYTILPVSVTTTGTVFISVNNGQYQAGEAPIVLNDSIKKISAYEAHPDFEQSPVVTLDIRYKSISWGATTLYPNPTSDSITLKMENNIRGTLLLTVFNAYGNTMSITQADKTSEILEVSLDVRDFEEGVYIYKVAYGNCEIIGKFIVQ